MKIVYTEKKGKNKHKKGDNCDALQFEAAGRRASRFQLELGGPPHIMFEVD